MDIDLYDKIISEDADKGVQIRLVVNEFRGEQYIQLRRYFQSYEGDWVPSKEGVSIKHTIQNLLNILEGLIEISSFEESTGIIDKFFKERLEKNVCGKN
jgi:hypothetical protein